MTDTIDLLDTPVSDDPVAVCLMFAAGAAVTYGAALLGCHALCERVRQKDRNEERER